MADNKILIENWFISHGLTISENQLMKLLTYIDLIRQTSQKMNLISKSDLPKIIERHLLDSLQALIAYEFQDKMRVADLGSGAGFPGIPIAIAKPNITVDLIESRRLKSLFLQNVADKLQLKNVKVIHERWEKLPDSCSYDAIMARAVYPENELKRLTLPRLTGNGVLLYFAKFNDIRLFPNPVQ